MQGTRPDPGHRDGSDARLFPVGFLFLRGTTVKPIAHLRERVITGLIRSAPGHSGVGTMFWPVAPRGRLGSRVLVSSNFLKH